MINKLSILAICFIIAQSCESEFIPPVITENELELVVEGHIEKSNSGIPPYVILTRSKAFFSSLNVDEFNELFVHNAKVIVNDGEKDVILPELCLGDLPEDIQKQLALEFGLDIETTNIDFCLYVDIAGQIDISNGIEYKLSIEAEDKTITSSTSIPSYVGLDSLWFKDVPGEPVDSLLRLWATVNDPEIENNYYRYFTGLIDEPLVIPFSSVVDDIFFDGKQFDFTINRAQSREEDFDPDTFGFFNTGDTIVVKWCNIDQAHFDFWNSLEFSLNSQGPFSSYTRVKSNIDGSLGIWGGYSCESYELIVEK